MAIIYSKKDGVLKPVDFTAKNQDFNGQVVFNINENTSNFTQYVCKKHTVAGSDAVEWHLHPIRFSGGNTPLNVLPQYHTYDTQTERLSTDTKITSDKLQVPKSQDFLTDEEKALALIFQKIERMKTVAEEVVGTVEEEDISPSATGRGALAGPHQPLSFNDLVRQNYHQYALQILLACVSTLDPNWIKETLAAHWQQIKDNALCYTTLSNYPLYRDLVQLFCEIAIATAKTLNQGKLERDSTFISPIALLMPGLTLKSQYPKSFPDLNNPKLNETPEALLRVLQTHIVGNQGTCLVPVSLLCNPENPLASETDKQQTMGAYPSVSIQTVNLQKLMNPYFDDDPARIDLTIDLTTDTCNRLKRFSPYHEALFQEKEEYDALLDEDRNTLLGQLKWLLKALHQYSAHRGVGRSDAMAEGGERAITVFFEYYDKVTKLDTKISPPKRDETVLNKIPGEIKPQLENLEMRKEIACSGQFTEKLEALVNQHGHVLATISIDQSTTSEFIEKKKQSFEYNQRKIREETDRLSGQDRLGLTVNMLALLKIKDHYHIRTMEDLYNLMQSSPEEIVLLSQLPGKSEEIIAALHGKDQKSGLENLSSLITTYSDQQFIAFFRANAHVLFDNKIGILNSGDFNTILDLMRESMCNSLLQEMLEKPVIQDVNQLVILLSCKKLNDKQRTQIWRAVENKLGEIITDGAQLLRLLKLSENLLDKEQRTQIWRAVENKLGEIITNDYHLSALFRLSENQLDKEQRTQIWRAVENKLGEIITNGAQLSGLFELSENQLDKKQRTQIWRAVENKLGEIITYGYHLLVLFRLSENQLDKEQRTQIWRAVENKLGEIITNGVLLSELFELSENQLDKEQRTQILTAVKNKLPKWIEGIKELKNFLEMFSLTDSQHKVIGIALQGQSWTAELLEEATKTVKSEKTTKNDLNTALLYLKTYYIIQAEAESKFSQGSQVLFTRYSAEEKLRAIQEILTGLGGQTSETSTRIKAAKEDGVLGELYTKLQKLQGHPHSPSAPSR